MPEKEQTDIYNARSLGYFYSLWHLLSYVHTSECKSQASVYLTKL